VRESSTSQSERVERNKEVFTTARNDATGQQEESQTENKSAMERKRERERAAIIACPPRWYFIGTLELLRGRCRANLKHIRQSRLGYGLGLIIFLVDILIVFEVEKVSERERERERERGRETGGQSRCRIPSSRLALIGPGRPAKFDGQISFFHPKKIALYGIWGARC